MSDSGPTPARPPLDLTMFGDEHVRRYRETDGEVGHIWNGAPCLILTTTRRRSRTPRDVPLIYGRDGGALVIVASKGGAPDHPDWYRDLVADPTCGVQVLAERFTATARTAEGEERARLWPVMTAVWPSYDDYQAATDREIPVVVLERR